MSAPENGTAHTEFDALRAEWLAKAQTKVTQPQVMELLDVSRASLWRYRDRFPDFPKAKRNWRNQWEFDRSQVEAWRAAHPEIGKRGRPRKPAPPPAPSTLK